MRTKFNGLHWKIYNLSIAIDFLVGTEQGGNVALPVGLQDHYVRRRMYAHMENGKVGRLDGVAQACPSVPISQSEKPETNRTGYMTKEGQHKAYRTEDRHSVPCTTGYVPWTYICASFE